MNQNDAMEELGRQIDRIDSLCHAIEIPLSDLYHMDRLREALPNICAEMKRYYAEASGENPWEE